MNLQDQKVGCPINVVVAEKNSVRNDIVSALKSKDYIITCVAGHIKSAAFTKKYPWKSANLADLLQSEIIFQNLYTQKASFQNLEVITKLKKPINLILAMDPDEQGDLIGYQVYQYLLSKKTDIVSLKKVKLESLKQKDIQKSFEKQENVFESQAYPGQLRARIDLWYGAILSRVSSIHFFERNKTWVTFNTGRVQSPTLNLTYERDLQIKNFVPEEYYNYKLELFNVKNEDTVVTDDAKIQNIDSTIKKKNQGSKNAIITVSQKNKTKIDKMMVSVQYKGSKPYIVEPKQGLNTDSLLLLLSKSAVFQNLSKTTKVLSQMYLDKYITYPRVENKSFNNYLELLKQTAALYSRNCNKKAIIPVYKPSKIVTDHSPIVPLQLQSETADPIYKKVLKVLYDHLHKVYSGPNVYNSHYYQIQLDDRKIGFSLLERVQKNFDDGLISYETVPCEDHKTTLTSVMITTKPPLPYNRASLLKKMASLKIGTKSTRATIIENLINNEYLYTDKTNRLIIKQKGKYICQYWLSFFQDILKSKFTRTLEGTFEKLKDKVDLQKHQINHRNVLKNVVQKIFNRNIKQ